MAHKKDIFLVVTVINLTSIQQPGGAWQTQELGSIFTSVRALPTISSLDPAELALPIRKVLDQSHTGRQVPFFSGFTSFAFFHIRFKCSALLMFSLASIIIFCSKYNLIILLLINSWESFLSKLTNAAYKVTPILTSATVQIQV